jgi:3-hydroxyacyl-CoA dehydrogenase
MSSTSGIFIREQTQLNESKHSDFLVLHFASQRSMFSLKEIVAIHFLADDTLLTFLSLDVWHHSIDCSMEFI